MPFPAYALISEDEFRTRFNAGGLDQKENIEAAIISATLELERLSDRLFVSRGSITEYHTIRSSERFEELWLGQYPFLSFTTVHEDTSSPPTYGAPTLLVAGTDYQTVAPDRIRRLSGGGGGAWWAPGNRSVRVVYTAGYANTAAVPYDLKQLCFELAALIFSENDKKRWGVQAQTDAAGNYQRFLGHITPDMEARINRYRRIEFHRTWEVAE